MGDHEQEVEKKLNIGIMKNKFAAVETTKTISMGLLLLIRINRPGVAGAVL